MGGRLNVAGAFTDRFTECLERVEYRLITGGTALEDVYRLRYDAYVREGLAHIDPEGRFSDAYDETENVWIFGVYLDGALASSIRVHVASARCPASPSVDVFPDILKPALGQGQTIVDPTRFVADRRLARRYPELPYITVRLGFLASERFGADLGLASVRAEHQAFYRRVFMQQPLCPPRSFPNLTAQFVLMGVDYLSVKQQIIARYPFMATTADELATLFGPAHDYPRNMAMAQAQFQAQGQTRPAPAWSAGPDAPARDVLHRLSAE